MEETTTQEVLQSETQTNEQTSASETKPFYEDFSDNELKEYVGKKGWKNVEAIAKSYRELEKFHGVPKDRLLKIPDENDLEGWNNLYAKLGRPETSDKYELPVPEGMPQDFAQEAAKWMYDAGISKSAAQKLAQKWNDYMMSEQRQKDYMMAVQKAYMEALKNKAEQELTELKHEWGDAYNARIETARRLYAQAGLSKEDIDAIESSIGAAKTLKFMAKLGDMIAESQFVEGNKKHIGVMTPQQAKERRDALIRDAEFRERLTKKDANALAEWDAVIRAMTAGKYE